MTPPGYERRIIGDRELVAHQSIARELGAILESGTTLYDWAAARPQPHAMRGRAPVYMVALPESGASVVVRHAWHGGLLAPITGDRFRVPTRAHVELHNSLRLQEAGIASSQVLAYALYAAGPALRRVDVVSRLVPDAFDLGAVVSQLAPGIDAAVALPLVRHLLLQLATHRVVHPDLNAKNVLLAADAKGAFRAVVIDVDVVRFDPRRAPAAVMRANVDRLARSLRKWRTRFGAPITDAVIDDFASSCLVAVPVSESRSRSA